MKLLRYGPKGHERPGLLDAKGQVRDLSALLPDIDAGHAGAGRLAALRALDVDALPVVPQGRLGACVAACGKFIAHRPELRRPCGRIEHADPEGADRLHEDRSSCAVGCQRRVVLPQGSVKSRLGGRARHRHRQPGALRVARPMR